MIWLIVVILFLYLTWHQVHKPSAGLFGKVIWRGPDSKRQIALTFDDGPNPLATPEVLKILSQSGVKATFFVLGHNAARFPQLLKAIAKAGHEIEIHGLNHSPFFIVMTPRHIRETISRTRDIIIALTGRTPHFYRPLFGNRTPWLLSQAEKLGLTSVTWSVDPQDSWLRPTPASIIAKARSQMHNGAIILLHDGCGTDACHREATIRALPELIKMIKEEKFSFATLDELLSPAKP